MDPRAPENPEALAIRLAKGWEDRQTMAARSSETEVIAQELETIGEKIRDLETRLGEVEAVIPRLEAAAATTARAMEEVSSHWDAVYRAMRRAE